MKRRQPKRDWSDARAKVEEEGECRYYRSDLGCAGQLEAAHVIGREHDDPTNQAGDRYVDPVSIIPLCKIHHDRYDGRTHPRIDILHVLDLAEQLQAVRDAGSVESMRRRTAPSAYRREAA